MPSIEEMKSLAQEHEFNRSQEDLDDMLSAKEEAMKSRLQEITGIEKLQKGKKHIDNAVDIQTMDGNWDYCEYMHGLANGLIFAQACLNGETPKYLEAPERWLREARKSAKSNNDSNN
jgi:hypothetical protein